MVSLGATNTRNITQPPQGPISRNGEKECCWTGKSNRLGDQGYMVLTIWFHKLCDFRPYYVGFVLVQVSQKQRLRHRFRWSLGWKRVRDSRKDKGRSWVRVCFQLKSSLCPVELWGINGTAKLSLLEVRRLSCYIPNSVSPGLNNGPRCAPILPGFFHKAASNQSQSPREGPWEWAVSSQACSYWGWILWPGHQQHSLKGRCSRYPLPPLPPSNPMGLQGNVWLPSQPKHPSFWPV